MGIDVKQYGQSLDMGAASPQTPAPTPTQTTLEDRVLSAVQAKVGDSFDAGLLKTIIQRVLKSAGGS